MPGRVTRLAAALGAGVALCAPSGAGADPFDRVEQLDAKLVRGQSTREDVSALFGKPDGKGSGRLPPTWAVQEVWLYQQVVVHSSQLNPDIRDGQMHADAEMRQLLVFFAGDRFDGYMWYGVRVEGEDLP